MLGAVMPQLLYSCNAAEELIATYLGDGLCLLELLVFYAAGLQLLS